LANRRRTLSLAQTCAAFAVVLPLTALPAAAACVGTRDIPYDIDLALDMPKPRLHRDRSIAELGEMHLHGAAGRVLGLTETNLEVAWHVGFEFRPDAEAPGNHCLWVRRVAIEVRHPAPDVYVAREYAPGSCPYRAILAHEQAHVDAVRDTVNRFTPRLRWVLTSLRIPTGRRPISVDSPEAGQARLEALMKELADPVIAEMAAALRAIHERLDSPAGYREVRKRCRNW
jgi:hypothetical protein